MRALVAKRNKSASANAQKARRADRDRLRRASFDKPTAAAAAATAAMGEGSGERQRADGGASPGSGGFCALGEQPARRRKSLAQRLGKLATKAASAVAGRAFSVGGGGGVGGAAESPTSPGVGFGSALLKRRSGLVAAAAGVAAGTVAVLWGDNVHHTVKHALVLCIYLQKNEPGLSCFFFFSKGAGLTRLAF
jgi:hypothetical protein